MEKRILIADDSPDIVRLIVGNLTGSEEDWKIFRAGNGEEAYEVARLECPNIILMDWDMPKMNGLEATRKIRKDEDTHDIPIIMATGEMTSAEHLKTALQAGAWDYVRKPIDFVELKARIHSALKLKKQNDEVKRLLESEIDLKNRKLSTTSMLIVEKNSLIQQFNDDLTELTQSLNKSDETQRLLKGDIIGIQKRLMYHLESDDSWDTFKMHFEDVHPNFFKLLMDRNPDMSHKDLKLCAYLKLGMDTKEIARMLNVTAPSIRTSMYRLKKKMNVKEKDSLREYLIKID